MSSNNVKTVSAYKKYYDNDGKVKTITCETCKGKNNKYDDVQKLMAHLKNDHGEDEKIVENMRNLVEELRDLSVVNRNSYELNDVKAMTKKGTHCDRDIGLNTITSRGQKQGNKDSPCVYVEADAATFEFVRNNINVIISDHDEVKEDLDGYRKVKVVSVEGHHCEVEEIRVFLVNNRFLVTVKKILVPYN